jgi:choline kinase
MKAILLSAGQGRRLLPLTSKLPKCLLRVRGQATILDEQLGALARCGVREAVLMVGFGADRVERAVAERRENGLAIRTCFNPFYAQSDNLVTAWLARHEMDGDFVLLNGDTLFEPAVLERLLARGRGPAALAVAHKALYDGDDMKVTLDAEGRLRAIGKNLEGRPDGEAIGMTVFRGEGAAALRGALDAAVRRDGALRDWYTSVLGELAARLPLHAVSIQGLWWTEIDDASDLDAARHALARDAAPRASVPRAADPAFAS